MSRRLGGSEIEAVCLATARELFARCPMPDVLAIDIPIGLLDRGDRECDRAARELLRRPRSGSVFPAPLRRVLGASSWGEACAMRRAIEGKGMSKQAWGLVAKVREVDRELAARPELRNRVREVHPEVSFCAWEGQPMRCRKTREEGRQERRSLVEEHFGAGAVERVRHRFPVKVVGHDDILDAFAALWSAERILRAEATTLPAAPPVDSYGIRMEIVY